MAHILGYVLLTVGGLWVIVAWLMSSMTITGQFNWGDFKLIAPLALVPIALGAFLIWWL